MSIARVFAASLLICAPLAACGHDHDDHEAVDQVAEGCKHMEFGPDIAVDATAAAMSTIETVHTRYLVTLEAEGDAFVGMITYDTAGGMHYLMFDEAVDLAITDASGATVTPSMVESDPASCDLAAVVYHVMLAEGSHAFDIGGAADASLQMVVHVAGAMHDHAH